MDRIPPPTSPPAAASGTKGARPSGGALVVGLTGSIGSGKSVVSALFQERGVPVIDADLLAREVVAPGSEGLAQVVREFGQGVLAADGTLDRTRLAEIVFHDAAARKRLEDILHPRIRSLFHHRLTELQHRKPSPSLILYAVPLLFESGYSYEELDRIVVVAAPPETCVHRIVERDKCAEELARKKLASQLPIETKVARADYVIHNDGSLERVREQVSALYQALLESANAQSHGA